MSRQYSSIAEAHNAPGLLEKLVNLNTAPDDYGHTLFELGKEFGIALSEKIDPSKTITLACTVEDADYLCRGILDYLHSLQRHVRLVVFWNKRFYADKEKRLPVAPIVKEYHEKGFDDSDVVVIVKSIISSSCVVRTNLTHLVERSNPTSIFVVAPVRLKGATDHLEQEFDQAISEKFQYLYFAEDSESDKNGIVYPGIGGDIYRRLGFADQKDKNASVPNLVKERRKSMR